jgi:hypothetical protein
MTTHAPAIDVGHDQPPLPNQQFSSWLRGQSALFISQIAAILGFVLFIALFILVLIRFLDDNERGSYRVKLVSDQVFKGINILDSPRQQSWLKEQRIKALSGLN